MSDLNPEFDTDADDTTTRPGQLSSNAHWIFGSIFAVLTLTGFGFGVWAGASKPKPAEVAEKPKDKDNTPKPSDKPPATPPVATPLKPDATPNPNPAPPVDPKPMDPKPMDPEPKPKDPEPKPKDPDPKPPSGKGDGGLASIGDGLTKEPGTKLPPVVVSKAVAFKEIEPILRTHCGKCHGLSAGKPKGGIDLRTIAAIKKGGNNGDILTVGDPMKSKLYTSLLPGASEPMPPDGGGPSEKEIVLIRDWIASGAKPRRTTVRRRIGRRSRERLELTPGSEAG